MVEEIIYLFILIIVSIPIAYLVAKVPLWICRVRAIKSGAIDITNNQIRDLVRIGCVNKKFFENYASFLKLGIKVNILDLAKHIQMGGNITNVLIGAKFAKENNIPIPVDTIMIWDLSKREIIESIKQYKGII